MDTITAPSAEIDKRAVRGLVVALDILKHGRDCSILEIEKRLLAAAKQAVANPSLQYDPHDLALSRAVIDVEMLRLECRHIELDEQRAERDGIATARPDVYAAKAQILAVVIKVLEGLRQAR